MASIISLDIFPQFMERTEVIYSPFFLDEKEIKPHDIALIEGCVSNNQQVEELKIIRKNAKKVYALGSCAAFGGIFNLSTKISGEPLSNYIEINGIIPGCPPPEKLLGNCLIRLIENREFELPQKNLCASCPLRETMDLKAIKKIEYSFSNAYKVMNHDNEKKQECFLNRGILCLGPITREGCEHICIKHNIPCEGCMGPISKDFTSNMVNFLGLFSLSKNLEKYHDIFYRFSKPKFKA
jgi:F420-non-reducing hydrogenase small subunit